MYLYSYNFEIIKDESVCRLEISEINPAVRMRLTELSWMQN